MAINEIICNPLVLGSGVKNKGVNWNKYCYCNQKCFMFFHLKGATICIHIMNSLTSYTSVTL